MKQETKLQTQSSPYSRWRRRIFAFTLASTFLLLWIIVGSILRLPGNSIIALLTVVNLVLLAGISAAMCYRCARQFGGGEAARWVWLLISICSTVDGLIVLTTWIPNFFPGHGLTTPLVLSSNSLAIVSRLLTGCSFWMMIRIYRQSGLRLKLGAVDFLAFAMLLVAELAMVMGEANMAHISSLREPMLEQWLKLLLPLSNLLLVVCSVLGIMIWRYARQMGGGLVAKAWQFVTLYLFFYILRRLVLGLVASSANPKVAALGISLYYILGFTCSYLLYLGASYQYEACTNAVLSSDEEMFAQLAEFDVQQLATASKE